MIAAILNAQENKTAYEISLEETEVVGTRAPLPADKAVRLVQVINRQDIEASSASSVNDLLKLAAGVDVRQRGGFGIQTDIGVNGGTEDQLTILLNGVFQEQANVTFDIMSPNVFVYAVIALIAVVTSLISALLPVTRLANKRPIDAIQNR